MLQMNDATALALRRSFEELANLSYRLREWLDLEIQLRLVETSFRPFSTKLQGVGAPAELAPQIPILNDLWAACRYPDLMDLHGFTQNIQYIHQPAMPAMPSYANPQAGIAALIEVADSIEQALANGNFPELKNQCDKFQRALAGQVANRKLWVKKEVGQLCALTDRLRMRLEE